MRRRPLPLKITASLLILLGAADLFFHVFSIYAPLNLLGSYRVELAPLSWLVSHASIFTGLLLWNASPWLRYWMPLWSLAVIVAFAFGLDPAVEGWTASQILAALSGGLPWLLLVPKGLRRVFFNPSQRWWMAAKRLPWAMDALVQTDAGLNFPSKTKNISMTGAYLELLAHPPTLEDVALREALAPGRSLVLRLVMEDQRVIKVRAEVVRLEAKGHPRHVGLGLRFISLPVSQGVLAAGSVLG